MTSQPSNEPERIRALLNKMAILVPTNPALDQTPPEPLMQIPDPMPHDTVGIVGAQAWMWCAMWAPAWLQAQTDPETMFDQIDQNVFAELARRVDQIDQSSMTPDQADDLQDTILTQVIAETVTLPPREVTEPVWDGTTQHHPEEMALTEATLHRLLDQDETH